MQASKLTGQMIATLRERLGLTQVELSEKLGIAENTVKNYEKGTRVDKEAPVVIPMLFDFALAAIDAGLPPYSTKVLRKVK